MIITKNKIIYNTLLLWLIPGDLLNASPHRQFHTLPGLLDSWAALTNYHPNVCVSSKEAGCNIFWYDLAGTQTHDLPCERRTRYLLSDPDTD